MKKLIAKVYKKLFRFLWPDRNKWSEYRKDVTEMTALVEEKWKQQMRAAMKNTTFRAPLKKQIRDGLDSVTSQCRNNIQGAFDRAYGPDVVKPVYVSIEALNGPLTPDMVPHPALPRCCPQCSGCYWRGWFKPYKFC